MPKLSITSLLKHVLMIPICKIAIFLKKISRLQKKTNFTSFLLKATKLLIKKNWMNLKVILFKILFNLISRNIPTKISLLIFVPIVKIAIEIKINKSFSIKKFIKSNKIL